MTERTLSKCQHKFSLSNCKACGIYNHPQDPALKTILYDSYLNCSAQKYLKHLRRRQCQQIQSKELHEQTYTLLLSICEKFEYQIETLALGVYVYAKTFAREEKQLSYKKFWASASLMVASKAIELDRRVPYLNRYQRYAQKLYTQSQYETAERKIFELLNHDLQKTTFISYLNFYLTNGIIFKSDALFPGSLKYLEDDIMAKASDYIKNGEFLKFEPEKLALKIIKEGRGLYRLVEWATGIGKVSGFKQEEIENNHKERSRIEILKPINNISIKKLEKLSSSFSINLESLSSTSLMQQKFKSLKKRNQPSLTLHKIQSMKQNTRKDEQKPYSISNSVQNVPITAPLAVLRNQLTNTSVMNINGNYSNVRINSSFNRLNRNHVDGVVPLSTFSKRG